jgi:hypothetical protein
MKQKIHRQASHRFSFTPLSSAPRNYALRSMKEIQMELGIYWSQIEGAHRCIANAKRLKAINRRADLQKRYFELAKGFLENAKLARLTFQTNDARLPV